MLTLYGQLEDGGDACVFTPARSLDRCSPNFGKSVRLPKHDVIVDQSYGFDSVRLSTSLARKCGLLPLPPQNTLAAMN